MSTFEERLKLANENLRSNAGTGIGCCERCTITWHDAKYHSTSINSNSGMFPLCEECWQELSPAERVPFYGALWAAWHQWGKPDIAWLDIEDAVMKGG